MSFPSRPKVTTLDLMRRKGGGPRIVVITAYDATMARLFDQAGVDILLVGDTLGMVVQGQDNTLSVTLEEMIYHTRMVARARPSAHIVGDMPFLSYQVSDEDAIRSAGRLVKEGGAESVKLEGGRRVAAAVERIVQAGIPVMGHVGLTPQSVNVMGGFKVQGRSPEARERILDDARCLEQAGVYAIVVEGVPSELGRAITEHVSVPTIGIGAGPGTDGQVLVSHDLLGFYEGKKLKFVKRYAELGDLTRAAVGEYLREVQSGVFPGPEHSFGGGEKS
jgi:3-methyl-2-oxobutanoate hydroxymethyltransferase